MKVNGVLNSLRTTLQGLSTQVRRMNVISENIANAERAPDKNGKVYQRKVLEFSGTRTSRARSFGDHMTLQMRRTNSGHILDSNMPDRLSDMRNGQRDPYKIVEQKGELLVYNTNHPQADENGYVRMPNVNMIEEMIDMISTSRTYEANVTVMDAAKQIAKRTMDI